MRRCPHNQVQFCPLYIAAHVPGAGGCDDGRIDDGRCAVDRGRLAYAARVARLRITNPGLVEEAEWRESAARALEQRARNRRLNGLH